MLRKHNIPVSEGRPSTSTGIAHKSDAGNLGNINNNKGFSAERTKSLSDTTLYAIALNRTPDRMANRNDMMMRMTNQMISSDRGGRQVSPMVRANNGGDNNIIEEISNFVDGVHIEDENRHRSGSKEVSAARYARDLASNVIIGVEKYRAKVNHPQGKQSQETGIGLNLGGAIGKVSLPQRHFLGIETGDNPNKVFDDDEFFHVSCHID